MSETPTPRSLEIAAQAWCTPETSHIEMNVSLAVAFAQILDRELAEARASRPMTWEAEIARQIEEGDGHWRPCSGCYETEDGHPVGSYPYSRVFKCTLGAGCHECGGLGACWEIFPTEKEVEAMMADDAAPPPVQGAGEPVDGLPTTLRFYTRHKYFESMDAAPLGGENWIEVDVVPRASLSPNTKEPT